MLTTRPRGTLDVTPAESYKWHYVEEQIRRITRQYGYAELRTPIFEHTELFDRGVGDTTDVVEKEMYTFTDKGGRSITLRPEGTAPAVRAYLEDRLEAEAQPVKVYYVGPIFRYERPQAGRLRQHTQFGVEVFGAGSPAVDAEIIHLAWDFLVRLGLTGLSVNVNSLGCPVCRPAHRQALLAYFQPHLAKLCPDCQRRYAKNPLRLLDCKNEACRAVAAGAPTILAHLCTECTDHFARLQELLAAFGVEYRVNPWIVRGFDYYTKTVFEIIYSGLGAQSTVCGGGRYDGLVGLLGGKPTPGIGFGLGLERLLLTMEKQGVLPEPPPGPDVFVATVGDEAGRRAPALVAGLRRQGVAADLDYLGRSLRGQLKYADKLRARFVLVLGEAELAAGKARLKEMATGEETEVPLEGLAVWLKQTGGSASREELEK
ncbi:MAG TPA: histidine--tRNA ligase [Firmicutes bacterium]|nr:histidine--tRNA ligase [Bacillota bacterium]